MSNIFLKNDLNGIFNEYTESNISLPNVINIIDNSTLKQNVKNKNSGSYHKNNEIMTATSSINNFENINNLSNTSTQNIEKLQTGGNGNSMSITNSDLNHDVSKLISMLTSESTSHSNEVNNTDLLSTEKLENQLRNILNKNKSFNKNKKSYGGNNINTQKTISHAEIKKYFINLKNQGVNVNIKLDNKTMSDFFDNAQLTTTDLKSNLSATSSNAMFGGNNKDSATSSDAMFVKNNKDSATSSMNMTGGRNVVESATSSMNMTGGRNVVESATSSINMLGGGNDIESATSSMNMTGGNNVESATSSMNMIGGGNDDESATSSANMTGGGMSEGFQQHLNFKKLIAEKLNIPNGIKPNKIIKAIKLDVINKYPNLTNKTEILKKAKEMFLKDMNNYKKLI